MPTPESSPRSPASSRSKSALEARQLQHWSLIKRFQEVLDEVSPRHPPPPTEHDPRRTLHRRDYFSLFLLGLFNPVLTSMRSLCKASAEPSVRHALGMGASPVSLGSFSEAQSLFDADLMAAVFERMAADMPVQSQPLGGGASAGKIGGVDLACLRVVDSTLWYVLPRMEWATWRRHYGSERKAVRLHVHYRLTDGLPDDAQPSEGTLCERKALRSRVKSGEFYIGDRNYGQDYGFLEELTAKDCGFLMRLRQNRVVEHTQESLPLSPQDIEAGVTRDELVMLGAREKTARGPFRLVVVERPGMKEPVWLVTNQDREQLSAAQVADLYRRRWEVEVFFRWLKCLLPCRHWFAESSNGVSLQIYAALVCALLLGQRLGRRPSKRMMEMLAFYQMGAADESAVERALQEEIGRAAHVRQPRYGSLQNWKPVR